MRARASGTRAERVGSEMQTDANRRSFLAPATAADANRARKRSTTRPPPGGAAALVAFDFDVPARLNAVETSRVACGAPRGRYPRGSAPREPRAGRETRGTDAPGLPGRAPVQRPDRRISSGRGLERKNSNPCLVWRRPPHAAGATGERRRWEGGERGGARGALSECEAGRRGEGAERDAVGRATQSPLDHGGHNQEHHAAGVIAPGVRYYYW